MGKVLCAEVVPRRLNIVYLRCVPMVGGGLQDTPQTGVKPEASGEGDAGRLLPPKSHSSWHLCWPQDS